MGIYYGDKLYGLRLQKDYGKYNILANFGNKDNITNEQIKECIEKYYKIKNTNKMDESLYIFGYVECSSTYCDTNYKDWIPIPIDVLENYKHY